MSEPEITPTTTPEDFLVPVLSDKKLQAGEYRARNRTFVVQSVHASEVAEFIEKGWQVQRAGKRTSLRRPKSHDQQLEDRVWCLLYKMAYDKLNGKRFIVQFDRDDESRGRKQIDVFACDAETAFVIECKSREVRGRRSLQKDLLETIALQTYIRKSVYSIYGSLPKPKIIWAYATQNIIWSEQDVARANDGGISILTENELQYLDTFVRHLGPAARYQVLGEFLKGQKVPGLGEVRLPAVRGKLGGETFYSFVATPRTLLKIAFINHQALNHPDGRPAYQRMISAGRIKEIEKFIAAGGYFPTNILVNLMEHPRFDLISNKENTDENIKFGWITLPSRYRSAWIIDGQHRLYGFSHLSGDELDRSLFVVAFEKMNTRKEADLFITINHKQKSVPKSLLISLLADIRLGDSDPKTALSALASGVVGTLNKDVTSPLTRRFAIPGLPPEPQQNLTMSEAVNGLVRSELLGRVIGARQAPGPLSGATDEDTIERAREILNAYFEALRASNPGRWEAGKAAYIAVNPGIRAHLMLIGEIVRYIGHKRGIDFHELSPKKFAETLVEVARPVFDYVRRASDDDVRAKFSRKFGEGGVKEYLYNLFKILHEERTDFGPEDFLKWVSQQESERIDEANRLVMQLSEKMHNCVIENLKAIHGSKRMRSGEEAFWEIGIESKKIKESAYKKQLEDADGRRQPKAAYLDFIELKDIIKQPNNWERFAPIFNLPLTGEKKGNKFYLSWMEQFNELRRIAAHKNQLRTYTDDDLEFLDKLRMELLPRLEADARVASTKELAVA